MSRNDHIDSRRLVRVFSSVNDVFYDVLNWSGASLDGSTIEQHLARGTGEIDLDEKTVPEADIIHADKDTVRGHQTDSLM